MVMSNLDEAVTFAKPYIMTLLELIDKELVELVATKIKLFEESLVKVGFTQSEAMEIIIATRRNLDNRK